MFVDATKREKGSSFSASRSPRCAIFLICFMRFFLWLHTMLNLELLVWEVPRVLRSAHDTSETPQAFHLLKLSSFL